jgi:hypothetical protein
LDITQPGAAEEMLRAAGLTPRGRYRTRGISEWRDFEIAWRAVSATGPAWSALQHCEEADAREAIRAALEPYYDQSLGYRLVSEYDYVLAEVN